ncbi:hypothetical protein [Aliikangiella sp. G2MR2-5]|uniref:hypothetical protein n=1 Tax=Aliikangiella sp. G2MR2-5 TaxID=2788943 RepID=UPI001AEE4F4E|nr:hypothetical protein [Aliikangiella sp. G2MR2-5]
MLFFVVFLLICFAGYRSSQENKRFKEAYDAFLEENEGSEFFCYTNRELFCSFIEEKLIPNLEGDIFIVKLEGKVPKSEFDEKFMSYSLCRLRNVGFPNVMKIVNGQFIDHSIHNEIYNAINNEKFDEVQTIVQNALLKIRGACKNA